MAVAPFSDNIQVNAPKAIDNRYGKIVGGKTVPFDSVTEALNMIPFEIRFVGMQVPVLVSGVLTEYWWNTTAGLNAAPVLKVVTPVDVPTLIEVELVTSLQNGAISSTTGAFDGSITTSKHSGFIAVNEGEQLVVSLETTDYNTSPPILGTGIAGYSAASYGSFVGTPLVNSYPKGDLMSAERYNQAHGTNLTSPITIVNEVITVPTGVKYIDGSSPNGVVLSIKALRPQGTLPNTIKQIYSKINEAGVNSGSSGGGGSTPGGVATDNNFTDDYKQKIDTLPTNFLDYRDGVLYLPDFGTGEQVKAYIKNKLWVIEALSNSFASFDYPMGYAYDDDKKNSATYLPLVSKAKIITAENGTTTGHLRPSENTWNWTEAQAIVNFCRANGMKMHWAHLLWLQFTPDWLDNKVAADLPNAKSILTNFITVTFTTVLNWIKTNAMDIVVSANVTNEWIYNGDGPNDASKGGKLKDSLWNTYFVDEELFELCFVTANQVHPGLIYYINDVTQETSNEKQSDTYKRLIASLKAKNIFVGTKQVQVEGMGFQMHTFTGLDIAVLKKRLKYWVDLGLKVMYTEMDVLSLTTTPAQYTVAKQQQQANTWNDAILAYERVVPAPQRGGIIFWTPSDKYYINNFGKNAPDATDNPITEFPAGHDYYGQPKALWQRMLELPNREELQWDIFQDFQATGAVSPIDGTMATGKTPLVWQKSGTAANVLAVNADGLGASQSSSNTYNFALLDYPYVNRMVTMKVSYLASATRTLILCIRYQGADDYIGVQATNSIWKLVKRSSATGSNVNTDLFTTAIVPKVGDVVKLVANGNQITFYLNGIALTTITETQYTNATKLGIKFRGYDDKFTRISEFGVNKL